MITRHSHAGQRQAAAAALGAPSGGISPATLHTPPASSPAEQRSAADTHFVATCGQSGCSLCLQVPMSARPHPSALLSAIHSPPPSPAPSLPRPRGWGGLIADAPTEEQARRGSEGPVPGQTKARSPFLWGTTPKMKECLQESAGAAAQAPQCLWRAGRASEGDNLPATPCAGGRAGAPGDSCSQTRTAVRGAAGDAPATTSSSRISGTLGGDGTGRSSPPGEGIGHRILPSSPGTS